MPNTRFMNPTPGTVSFSNAEVLALQQMAQKLYSADNQGMWWNTTPNSLLSELNTEVITNRSLNPVPIER